MHPPAIPSLNCLKILSLLLTPSPAISDPSWILSLVLSLSFGPYIACGSYYPVAKNTGVNTWQSFTVYMNVTNFKTFLPWIWFPYVDYKGGGKSSLRWGVLTSQCSMWSRRHGVCFHVYSSPQVAGWGARGGRKSLFGWGSFLLKFPRQNSILKTKLNDVLHCLILLSGGLAGLAFLLLMQQVNEQEKIEKQGTVPWNLVLPSCLH